MTREEQIEVFRILFAILYIGNIEFGENNQEQSFINNRDG
jgi:myosin heavy subunit